MLLAIDIGNTNITLGIFDDKKIVEVFRTISDINSSKNQFELLFHKISAKYKIDSCIIASVVKELDKITKNAVDTYFGINSIIFDKNNTEIKLDIDKPETVGADRVLNAYSAYKQYPKPVIVVDSGTAITLDIVNRDGCFVGGVIMAGLKMQLNALYKNTSLLPEISLKNINTTIAKNTENSILSGVVRGTACAVEGLVKECEKELGQKATLIATGGTVNYIAKNMSRNFDYINPELTLEGLKFFYDSINNSVT